MVNIFIIECHIFIIIIDKQDVQAGFLLNIASCQVSVPQLSDRLVFIPKGHQSLYLYSTDHMLTIRKMS